MTTHNNDKFELFLSQLQETNATLSYYSDFRKIAKNVANISISLNMLNYLLGKDNLRYAVEELWERDKRAFEVMDILIATRKKDHKKFWDDLGNLRLVHSLFDSVDGIMEFLEGTGLADVFRKQDIKDLVDYVFGVETGLDSNARKNRSGQITEKLIGDIFSKASIAFQSQVSSRNFSQIARVLGADQKVFDFVVTTNIKTYLIEVNFYSDGGSKLNETARSYTDVAPKVNSVDGFEFVWITDGNGWNKAKNKLQEAFATIPRIYNLTTIKDFVEEIKIEGIVSNSLF